MGVNLFSKSLLLKKCLLVLAVLIYQLSYSASYNWTGSTDTDWSKSGNWYPAVVPGPADNVTIVTASNLPSITAGNTTVASFTMTSGTLNLGGYTLTITGSSSFSSGAINNGTVQITSSTGTATFTGTVFGANVIVNCANINLNGSTFNGTAYFAKTGTATNNCNGGNTFNSTVTFNLSANGQWVQSLYYKDTYNNDVVIINQSTSSLNFAQGAAADFNGDIIINQSNAAGYIYIGNTGPAMLASAKTIKGGSNGGFGYGTLWLQNFKYTGTVPFDLTSAGGIVSFNSGGEYACPVNISTPGVLFNGGTFNGAVNIVKTGTAASTSKGGSTFNAAVKITNNTNSTVGFAQITKDVFNSTLTLVNTAGGTINMSNIAANNEYHGDVFLNQTGGTLAFGAGNGTSKLFSGSSIKAGTDGGFTGGNLSLKGFLYEGTDPFNITTAGSISFLQGCVINCPVTLSAGIITATASTFDGALNMTATGAVTFTNDQCHSDVTCKGSNVSFTGNTISGNVNLERTGTGLDYCGGNTFGSVAKTTSIKNSGTGAIYLGNTGADIFNGDLTVTANNSGWIYMAANFSGTVFNGDIYLNKTSGANGFDFGNSAAASCTLAVNKKIIATSSSFSTGTLNLRRMFQSGNTLQEWDLPGVTVSLEQCTFQGSLQIRSFMVNLKNNWFLQAARIEKSGITNQAADYSYGGNKFDAPVEFVNSNAGTIFLASTVPDIYNTDVTVTCQGGNVFLAYNFVENLFNGDLVLNKAGTGGSINLGRSGAGTAKFVAAKTIKAGSSGISGGNIYLYGIRQSDNTAISLTGTGNTYILLREGNVFTGKVSITAPNIEIRQSTFNGGSYFEKTTGGSDNNVYGGNIFEGKTEIKNSSLNNLTLAYNVADIFNGDAEFISSNNNYIFPAYNGSTTYFNGNIILNKPAGNYGFSFGAGTGSSVLADGKTITYAPTTNTGFLFINFKKFTQVGITPQSIYALNNAVSSSIQFDNCSFSGPVSFKAYNIIMRQSTFWGTARFEKYAMNNGGYDSDGGNVFKSTVEYVNSGNMFWNHAMIFPDTYEGDVTVTTGTGLISLGYGAGETAFRGNININLSGSGTLNIGGPNNSTVSLAAGKTIQAGSNGFTGGTLNVYKLTQSGAAPIVLNGTGITTIYFGPGITINGDLTLTASVVIFKGPSSTYNGIVNVTMNGGSGNVYWQNGVLTFNNDVIINYNSTTASLYLTYSSDVFKFNGNFTVNRAPGAGWVLAAAYGIAEFYKNVTYNYSGGASTWPYHFGYNGGVCKFLGSQPQTISSNNNNLLFFKMLVDKPVNHVTVATNIDFVPSPSPSAPPVLTLNQGKLICAAGKYVSLADNGTVSLSSSQSFVDGPFRKIGDDAFTFPIGKGNLYMPIAMSAPAATGTFQAEYFPAAPAGASLTLPLRDVSNCEYWDVQRILGTSTPKLTLFWGAQNCSPVNSNILTVARRNGNTWADAGVSSATGNNSSGSIVSNVITQFGNVTFGYKSVLVLDTRDVNAASYTVTAGAEPGQSFTSGPAGSVAGIKTLVSSQNNFPGIAVIHPDLSSSSVTLDIAQGLQNKTMQHKLSTDNSNNITLVQGDFEGSYYPMASDYHSIESLNGSNCKLIFHRKKASDPVLDITTNLPDGLIFDVSELNYFMITVPGAGFSGYRLRIYDKASQPVYASPLLTTGPVQWDGRNNGNVCAQGTYKFELDIISGGNTNTYYGQILVRP